jgi:hypothetical protein
MSSRIRRLSLACLLFASGPLSAKPPELPLDPRIDGKERTPVELEFFAPMTPAPQSGVVAPVGGVRLPIPPADAVTDLLALAWAISR